ncbi:MAG: response regulator [Nitrospirae bacterium]|nr:response regulator [Nitrospirota bacterium]
MFIQRPRILCVDDEPANLKLLEAILVPRGYDVIMVENGREAIEKIKEKNIAMVLLDVMMPEIDGFEVCKMIKENERFRNIPIIMITALRSKEDRVKGIAVGVEDFISKPFDQAEVLARIKMLLKIKDLNDRLNFAYANVNYLTCLGEEIIKSFNPLDFDFISCIDSIIHRIIRHADEMIEKPQVVIVYISNKSCHWYKYESLSQKLNRTLLEFDFDCGQCLPERSSSKIVFHNETKLVNSEFNSFIEKLKSINISVSNIVSYMSNEFCIFALNYGRNVTEYDASVLNSLVMQSLFLKSLSTQVKETDDAFAYTVQTLARAAEVNDEDTGNHIVRIGEYCALLAKHFGMSEKFVNIIKLQAQMHDVGKIHIPPEILRKPGKLMPEEFLKMTDHTIYGAKILGDHVRLTMAKNIALSHHERWFGGGYPYGIRGEQIPVEGRIASIADQYDALRNQRIYKLAFNHETTYRIITEGDERTMPHHFDPQVLKAFKETASQFEEVYEKLRW